MAKKAGRHTPPCYPHFFIKLFIALPINAFSNPILSMQKESTIRVFHGFALLMSNAVIALQQIEKTKFEQ